VVVLQLLRHGVVHERAVDAILTKLASIESRPLRAQLLLCSRLLRLCRLFELAPALARQRLRAPLRNAHRFLSQRDRRPAAFHAVGRPVAKASAQPASAASAATAAVACCDAGDQIISNTAVFLDAAVQLPRVG
jgi:hypothetical protein